MTSPARKKSDQPRPRLVPASEELRMFVAALEHELQSWPKVRLKPMFGLTAVYRGPAIFALLPKTRSFHSGDSIWVKFEEPGSSIRARLAASSRILPHGKP